MLGTATVHANCRRLVGTSQRFVLRTTYILRIRWYKASNEACELFVVAMSVQQCVHRREEHCTLLPMIYSFASINSSVHPFAAE